jgi:hypothetical protein
MSDSGGRRLRPSAPIESGCRPLALLTAGRTPLTFPHQYGQTSVSARVTQRGAAFMISRP